MPAAYQDENGKWYKQCSKTKQIFGPVDNKEDLSEWFYKNQTRVDGFTFECKKVKKQYFQTAAGLLAKYKGNAKKRKINFTLTLEWFEEQMTKPEFNVCAISGIKFVVSDNPNEPFTRSLDRISSTKGYTPDNVRWVCYSHNSWKSDMTVWDIARHLKYSAKANNLDPHEILNQVS